MKKTTRRPKAKKKVVARKVNGTSVPGPTIRGTYNTHEDRKRRDLVAALGHVVDLELENLVQIEVGGWGTNLKMRTKPGVGVLTALQEDGSTIVRLTPPGQFRMPT